MPSGQITITADSHLSQKELQRKLDELGDKLKAEVERNELTNVRVVSSAQE